MCFIGMTTCTVFPKHVVQACNDSEKVLLSLLPCRLKHARLDFLPSHHRTLYCWLQSVKSVGECVYCVCEWVRERERVCVGAILGWLGKSWLSGIWEKCYWQVSNWGIPFCCPLETLTHRNRLQTCTCTHWLKLTFTCSFSCTHTHLHACSLTNTQHWQKKY